MKKYLVILLIINSCTKIDQSVSLEVFYPNIDMSIEALIKKKFERVNGVDVTILSFQHADTSITFSLFRDSTLLTSQKWEIMFHEKLDSMSLINFFHSRNLTILGNANYKTKDSFCALNWVNNLVFVCDIDHFDNYDKIVITYYYPFKKEQYLSPSIIE